MTIRTPVNSYSLSAGNGSQTTFAFPFSQFETDDLFVYVWNSTTEQWDKKTSGTHYNINASTVVFTAGNVPSAPPTGVTGNVLVLRKTDVDEDYPQALFSAGSAIKSGDLNNNQKQALRAIKELRDTYLSAYAQIDESTGTTTNPKMYANLDMTGRRIYNVGAANSDDDVVTRKQLGDVIAIDITGDATQGIVLTKTESGSNSGDEMEISIADSSPSQKGSVIIQQAAGEAVNVSYSSGTATIGVDKSTAAQQGVVTVSEEASTAINITYTADGEVSVGVDKSTAAQQGVVQISATTPIQLDRPADGEVELSIPDGSVDLAKLKPEDVRTLAEQNADPNAAGSDDEIGTTAALNKRHDIIYQSGTPSGSDWFVGKMWYDHTNDQTLSIWNGSNWLGVSSGGTFITQPTVIWVDSVNGDDANDGHRIIDAMKTIKAAVASADNGDIVLVNPGIYREVAPIDITVNNLSIVGQSIRSCFVHPTPATETESLFRVNSGTLISNFSFAGIKASGVRGGHPVDNDPVYGLPTNQGWLASFYPNAVIYKSPYIQNCTNFSDSSIPNWTEAEYNDQATYPQATAYFDPNNVSQGGFGGDLTSGPTGGGLFIDGSVPAVNSPLRSMVVDSFTQITLDGPGCLCANNGYAQLVSFFGTFAHYHAKALKGGQLNLSNCTTDFGRYGLIADGKSPTAVFTASVSANAAAGAITFTIGSPTASPTWFGAATKPQDSMLVQIGSDIYPILSSVANGSGWDVTVLNPNPVKLSENLGLINAITAGDTASFYQRSFVSTGGHTFEYVGSGTNYTALPENGGTADETKQAISLNNGKVWQSSTDHNGVFKVGDTFKVDQRSGTVSISLDAYRPEIINDLTPQLGGDLDVNGYDITGTVKLNGITYPAVDGALNHIMVTDGNGTLSFQPIGNLTGAGLQAIVDDTTPELGGNLDVNGYSIVSTSNGDITLTPNGTGSVVLDGLNYPQTDGTAGQAIVTDGAGNLTFSDVAAPTLDGGNFDTGGSLVTSTTTIDGGSFD